MGLSTGDNRPQKSASINGESAPHFTLIAKPSCQSETHFNALRFCSMNSPPQQTLIIVGKKYSLSIPLCYDFNAWQHDICRGLKSSETTRLINMCLALEILHDNKTFDVQTCKVGVFFSYSNLVLFYGMQWWYYWRKRNWHSQAKSLSFSKWTICPLLPILRGKKCAGFHDNLLQFCFLLRVTLTAEFHHLLASLTSQQPVNDGYICHP